MVIHAVSRRTGEDVAQLHISDQGMFTVMADGGREDGCAGPFETVFWSAAMAVLGRKYPDQRSRPGLREALENGLVTPMEMALALPPAYGSLNFIRG